MAQVTEKDLKTEVEDMRQRYRNLKDDELFVAWFMKCFVTVGSQNLGTPFD